MKVKIITGFRDDQFYSIDMDEVHKAYYLFMNPEQRGIFNNGVALIGKIIQGIEPDYNATMGWNSTHKLDADDFKEIKSKGIDKKFQIGLCKAKEVAKLMDKDGSLAAQELSSIELKQHGMLTHGFKPREFFS